MKRLVAPCLIIAIFGPDSAQYRERHVLLDKGATLHVVEMPFSRALPTAPCDQAIASTPVPYPNSGIVAARRCGRFGNQAVCSHSMACCEQTAAVDEATVAGVVISNGRATSFETTVSSPLILRTLICALEVSSGSTFEQ
jgi:hypothetical protein